MRIVNANRVRADMTYTNIVYAAEKPSIATILSEHVQRSVAPGDINVTENPDETGSFFVQWHFDRYKLSPNGELVADDLELSGRAV